MYYRSTLRSLRLESRPNKFRYRNEIKLLWYQAGNFAPPVGSFLEEAKLRGKRIALFCAHGGDNPGKSFENLEKELSANSIVGKIDFKMDMIPAGQLERNLQAAAEWASGIAGK